MGATRDGNGEGICEGLERGDRVATEQIDWSSFIDFEYDPTNTVASAAGQSASNDRPVETSLNPTQISDPNSIESTIQDIPALDTFDFPSIEEWWAGLPNESQPGDWVSPNESAILPGDTPYSDSNSSAYADVYSPSVGSEGSGTKRRRRMPPDAKRLLTDCFERHRRDPYIPKEEVQQLATDTGLSIRQVQTFFANARARKLPRAGKASAGVNIPALPNQQGPMERFLSSSPEDEGISEEAVRAAANTLNRPIKPARSRKGRAPSVRSSSQNSTSNSSSASMDSLDSRGSRKGRKRQREPSKTVAKSIFRRPSSPSRKYQCTFCHLDFEQKYDWKRHEESVHFPQKEWVCMPNGPIENSQCVFCGSVKVDEEHLKSHKSITCSEAPRTLRTFQRKDKLVQHIKQVHGCPAPNMIKEWCKPIERKLLLLCGFCCLALPDWKTRADHIASHFSNGIVMTLWIPELIGSIWPEDDTTKNYVRDKLSATDNPDGQVICDNCPARFSHLGNLALHRRQVHNVYLPTDAKVVLGRQAGGAHRQRLINLAQQTSRIQIARTEESWVDSMPQNVHGQGPVTATVGPLKPMPIGMRPPINQQLDAPERRGFSNAPHSAWVKVLNSQLVVPPRTPMGSPLSQQPSMPSPRGQLPARTHLRQSNLRSSGLSQSEVAAEVAANADPSRRQEGPPVEAIRSILRNNRDQVGHVGEPVQGMLHSLEQFGDNEAAWPRPPDSSVL